MNEQWKYDEPSNWHGIAGRVTNEKGEPIAQVPLSGWPLKKGRAHGHLIAAAPALLEALQDLTADANFLRSKPKRLQERIEAARAAIALATKGGE